MLIKDHFILVDLQAKSQTSLVDLQAKSQTSNDVTDRDLLDKAGFRPVPRHEIVKEKSVEELNAQLVRHSYVSLGLTKQIGSQKKDG